MGMRDTNYMNKNALDSLLNGLAQVFDKKDLKKVDEVKDSVKKIDEYLTLITDLKDVVNKFDRWLTQLFDKILIGLKNHHENKKFKPEMDLYKQNSKTEEKEIYKCENGLAINIYRNVCISYKMDNYKIKVTVCLRVNGCSFKVHIDNAVGHGEKLREILTSIKVNKIKEVDAKQDEKHFDFASTPFCTLVEVESKIEEIVDKVCEIVNSIHDTNWSK